jgi:ankyrin repeat protein
MHLLLGELQSHGKTALAIAAERNQKDTVQMLLRHSKVDPNLRDRVGRKDFNDTLSIFILEL